MLDKNEIVLEAWLVTRRFPTASGKPMLVNNDINLKFSKGKTLGLVGESGCGKSTFMRFLVSLDRPSQGEILHREQDITKLKGEALRRSRQNIQIMAFATGSSWGTFAICMPLAPPLAFAFTGNELTILVVAVFATVAGGGVFGDHCSPLSDTTILSSTGAACDHPDHVKTQLPYALVCGAIALAGYLLVGLAI